jgi:hypothetical protein
MQVAWTLDSDRSGKLARRLAARRRTRRLSTRRHRWVVVLSSLIVLTGVGVAFGAANDGVAPVARDGSVSLWQSTQGLATSDSFARVLPLRDLEDAFTFDGSASPGVGYAVLGAQGLEVGVHAHPNRFEGWFAVSSAAYPPTGVYHVDMSRQPGNVSGSGAQGEAVFAVQTGTTPVNGLINYVVVASNSRHGATTWSIGYAHGVIADAKLETLAKFGPSTSSPLNEQISLVTDGRHRLSVYFGSRLVYSADNLHLEIQPPFQPYLEVQGRRIAYTSFFHDLWITSGTTVSVDDVASGWRLSLVGSGGNVLASALSHDGQVRLHVPVPEAHGRAVLVARRDGRVLRLGPFSYSGGDVYRLSGLGDAVG